MLTNEVTVAQSLGTTLVRCLDELFDDDHAERLNAQLWDLAFSWFRAGDHDPTMVEGISAGDLAGTEAAISILIPAARGVLEAQAALRQFTPTEVTVVVPTASPGNYSRIESLQARSFGHALSELGGHGVVCTNVVSDDLRNERLVRKFARTRDPGWPNAETPRRALMARALAIAGVVARLNPRARRRSLVVFEYGPTKSFASRYAASAGRSLRLIRFQGPPRELARVALAGDRIVLPPRPSGRSLGAAPPGDLRLALDAHGEAVRQRFVLEGVDLWPLVGPQLVGLVARYAPSAEAGAISYRRELRRWRSDAVLVPYDTPPDARLLMRVAHELGIPSFVISDGFKGDDFSREGMATDVALAWSAGLRDRFFRRRPDGTAVITGNPAADHPRQIRARRSAPVSQILVGSFTFSPIDLNCRRSDAERYLADVLEGIGHSSVAIDRVVIKLHPADVTDHYREILERHSGLPLEIVASGDVNDLLERFDLYIATYSTSLIEAVARGIPVMYYRVNRQHLHPPFRGDPFISLRTASSPDEVTRLLDRPPPEFDTVERRIGWTEQFLGPQDGRSVERIVAAIQGRFQPAPPPTEPSRS